jgi:sugar lactone lactonase YvrE
MGAQAVRRVIGWERLRGLATCGLVFVGGTLLPADSSAEETTATHHQERLIQVVRPKAGDKLTTFAVDAKGRVLAGVSGHASLLRVYDAYGEQEAEWPLPVPPEAVNVGPQGDVFVAGQGVLLKLDDVGQIALRREAPNMPGAAAAAKGIQKRIQEARHNPNSRLQAQIVTYKKRLADIERKLAAVDHDLVELDKQQLANDSDSEAKTIETARKGLQKRRDTYVRLQANLVKNITNPPGAKAAKTRPNLAVSAVAAEPPAEIRELIAAQMRVASISASKDEVFLACSSSTGSGFDVWRTDHEFAKPKKIGESLRGCCGQLDVQANDNGIYVAENTRHRVRGFSRDGAPLVTFGSRERGRDDTFEGCCNPMNVAFGVDGSVYTAESGSGRIKRFTANGKFMELVGQVELVPGCKKVSIAVSPRGDTVYMLDITRGHIVVMASGNGQASAAAGPTTVAAVTTRAEQP